MSSLVYFDSRPGSNQLVSEENTLRKINFCRAVPAALQIVGLKSYTHPAYEMFINYFPIALRAARTATQVSVSNREAY